MPDPFDIAEPTPGPTAPKTDAGVSVSQRLRIARGAVWGGYIVYAFTQLAGFKDALQRQQSAMQESAVGTMYLFDLLAVWTICYAIDTAFLRRR